MKKPSISFIISNSITVLIAVVLALLSHGLIASYAYLVAGASVLVFATTLLFYFKKKETIKALSNESIAKLLFIVNVVIAFAAVLIFFFDQIGIFEVADSVEDMRDYIKHFPYVKWAFIGIQFFQVLFLPIPTTITLLAGLLLFSPWEVIGFSMAAIIPASIIMFWFGRVAGRKAAEWVLGAEDVEKYLNMIKGKDVSMLTVMFLLPFFPDDTLCMIAGLSTMKFAYFLPVNTLGRFFMCVSNVLLLGTSAIPFKGWGIPVWILIGAVVVGLLYISFKKGDVIQQKVESLFKGKNKNKIKEDNSSNEQN
ncbi:MAG: TVP38/TMEM64 family protein [Clostridia bacterium]|nr:TVP38/TMEM64 family protein [Clostridia bacterium]